jgi:hypothetical protein
MKNKVVCFSMQQKPLYGNDYCYTGNYWIVMEGLPGAGTTEISSGVLPFDCVETE